MKKRLYIFPAIAICSFLLLFAFDKLKEPAGEKVVPGQKEQAVQPVPLARESRPPALRHDSGDKMKTFEGCLSSRSLTEENALEYLDILLKGDSETLDFYKAYEGYQKMRQDKNLTPVYSPALNRAELYQKDVCLALNALSDKMDKESYELILEIVKQKAEYPMARACAAGALMLYGEIKDGRWHGDTRSIPVLNEILNDKDPAVRLQAAGTLLSLGKGDTALPVLEEIAGSGTVLSIPALGKLFAFEGEDDSGEKQTVISETKLWDERGGEILVKALDNPNTEVRAFAALKLTGIGIKRQKAEDVSLDILNRLKFKKRRDYKDLNRRESDRAAGLTAIDALEKIRSASLAGVLKTLIENSDDPYLITRARQAVETSGK